MRKFLLNFVMVLGMTLGLLLFGYGMVAPPDVGFIEFYWIN
jgi:multisubunit Na+/H+ antiporter MnhB subunit